MKSIFIYIVILLTTVNPSFGSPVDKLLSDVEDCKQGQSFKCFSLALMIEEQEDATYDDKSRALALYKIAAEQGMARAQYNLGLMYHRGLGTPKNVEKAFKWYKESAEQGIDNAQAQLGIMYYSGEATPRNYEKS